LSCSETVFQTQFLTTH